MPRIRSTTPRLALVAGLLLAVPACGESAGGQEAAGEGGGVSAVTGGSVWVMSGVDRSVTVIDPESATPARRIDLGFRSDPSDMAYWAGSVWVGSAGGSLQRIDAANRTLVETIPLEMDVWKVSAADHGIYAMDAERALVTRHDPGTGALLATLDPPDRVHAMAAGPDGTAVFVGDRVEVHLYPAGSTESRVVAGDLGGGDMVLGFGSFWIYHPAGKLLRVDPESAAVEAEVEMDADLYFPGLAIGAGAVWVTSGETGEVIRVDPATDRVAGRIPVGGSPEHVAVLGDALWVILPQDDAVVRIDIASGAETARLELEYPLRVVAVP